MSELYNRGSSASTRVTIANELRSRTSRIGGCRQLYGLARRRNAGVSNLRQLRRHREGKGRPSRIIFNVAKNDRPAASSAKRARIDLSPSAEESLSKLGE